MRMLIWEGESIYSLLQGSWKVQVSKKGSLLDYITSKLNIVAMNSIFPALWIFWTLLKALLYDGSVKEQPYA